jgi:Polyketide cyclase / dehydrase and lipid transport
VALESRQLGVLIDRPVNEVYEYASDPVNLPEWAPGLGSAVVEVDGHWYVETFAGRAGIVFAPRNDFGILDHDVTMPSGDVFYNPMRVFANEDGSEVVFTLRRSPGMSSEDFERDAGLVSADLARLKQVLERTGSAG